MEEVALDLGLRCGPQTEGTTLESVVYPGGKEVIQAETNEAFCDQWQIS